MTKYKNIDGSSNVESYEIGSDFIIVKFYDTDKLYKYSYKSAGKINVDNMKSLAKSGNGLNGYINKHCKYRYE